jgi:hypothetical protein
LSAGRQQAAPARNAQQFGKGDQRGSAREMIKTVGKALCWSELTEQWDDEDKGNGAKRSEEERGALLFLLNCNR